VLTAFQQVEDSLASERILTQQMQQQQGGSSIGGSALSIWRRRGIRPASTRTSMLLTAAEHAG